MEEADLPAIPYFGREAAIGEELFHLVVQFQAVDAWFHLFQRQFLPCPHGFPQAPLLLAGPSSHPRPRHVAEVAGPGVAGKNVEDNERIRLEWAEAAFMRITRLIAAGHD